MAAISSGVPEFRFRQWMLFVDGENLTIRGQELLSDRGITPNPGPLWQKDVFLWIPGMPNATQFSQIFGIRSDGPWADFAKTAIRAYYYTSLTGDDAALDGVRNALWELGFDPNVFKKASKTRRSKAVDITLATDMLTHAFMNHFDGVILIAGDGDYVPLVEAVKRQGKLVQQVFFRQWASRELELAADWSGDWTDAFLQDWTAEARKIGGRRASPRKPRKAAKKIAKPGGS